MPAIRHCRVRVRTRVRAAVSRIGCIAAYEATRLVVREAFHFPDDSLELDSFRFLPGAGNMGRKLRDGRFLEQVQDGTSRCMRARMCPSS